jgi:hypothetical protein
MRKTGEVYWTVSLPKGHEALQALDAYCKEWGGLSRSEATRRLLLEWNKIQRGQPIAAWYLPLSSSSTESVALERAPRTAGGVSKQASVSPSARAASQALDE